MSPHNQAQKSRKFITHRSLLIADVSPLPHLPSYSVSYSPSCPEGSSGDCLAGYPVRNPESQLVCCSVSYCAGYPERNSASCAESCGESNWENSPSDRPENCRASSPESNLPSSGADNPLGHSESNPADSAAGHQAGGSHNSDHYAKGHRHHCGQPTRRRVQGTW
jgi:hypothetical protein